MNAKTFFTWVRLPTVFSGLCNAYAGWWIGSQFWGRGGVSAAGVAHDALNATSAAPVAGLGGLANLGLGHLDVTPLLLGMLASGLMLMAGMGLNDIADYKVDLKERPNRPLPSGALPISQAWLMVILMMAAALGLQYLANPHAAGVGLILVAAIFLYNFALKGSWLGPASMGACRFLNLLSGIALHWQSWPDFGSLPTVVRLGLLSIWLYIVAVTYLARDEVQGNARTRIRYFLLLLGAWIGLWVASGLRGITPWYGVVPVLMAMGYFLAPVLKALWQKPNGPNTGKTIGTLLRCLPLVDMLAIFASGAPWPAAVAAALFMVPGSYLAKRFYST